MSRFETLSDAYVAMNRQLLAQPEVLVERTGQRTRELIGVQFEVERPWDLCIHPAARRWSPEYFAGELVWYLSGSDKLADIAPYSKFWNSVSDDGVTLRSAYGARLFRVREEYGWISQWDRVGRLLKLDRSSRRAVLHLKYPSDDVFRSKDTPCTMTLQFILRDSALHLIATLRSNDVIFGLGYDGPIFCTFLCLMASILDVRPGAYIHQAGSLHVYDRHYEMAEGIASGESAECLALAMPTWDPWMINWVVLAEKEMRTHYRDDWKTVLKRDAVSGFWREIIEILYARWSRPNADG